MKILCPIDFSKESMHAISFASTLVNKIDSELILLCILESPSSQIPDEYKHKMENLLVGLSSTLPSRVIIKTEFSHGIPNKDITKIADDKKVDLIIMGTQGMSTYDNIFFGSVSEYTIEHANVPVIVIPLTAKLNQHIDKIALALDDNIIDNEYIFSLPNLMAQQFNTKIDLVHINKPNQSSFPFDPFVLNYLGEYAGEFIILEDPMPTFAINTIIETKNLDLLIMIRRDQGFIKQLFGINYTKEQMNTIKIPLMIIPEKINLV